MSRFQSRIESASVQSVINGSRLLKDEAKKVSYNLVHEVGIEMIRVVGVIADHKTTPGRLTVDKAITKILKFTDPSSFVAEKLYYCQSKIGDAQDSGNGDVENFANVILNHDYLVIKMKNSQGFLYVRAEKIAEPTGIFITEEEKFVEEAHTIPIVIDLYGAELGLKELVDLLQAHDFSYNVFEKNCWEYATGTTQRVGRRVLEKLEKGSNESKTLQKQIENIKAIITRRVFKNLKSMLVPSFSSTIRSS